MERRASWDVRRYFSSRCRSSGRSIRRHGVEMEMDSRRGVMIKPID